LASAVSASGAFRHSRRKRALDDVCCGTHRALTFVDTRARLAKAGLGLAVIADGEAR
jgi:hypothetical protein